MPDSYRAARKSHDPSLTAATDRARKVAGALARPASTEPVYLRTEQVGAILHVSPKTVSRWAQEGRLPFQRTLGGHRRFDPVKIRELADTLTIDATVPPGYGTGAPRDPDERDA
jgi:excisionase family DNA binding protein